MGTPKCFFSLPFFFEWSKFVRCHKMQKPWGFNSHFEQSWAEGRSNLHAAIGCKLQSLSIHSFYIDNNPSIGLKKPSAFRIDRHEGIPFQKSISHIPGLPKAQVPLENSKAFQYRHHLWYQFNKPRACQMASWPAQPPKYVVFLLLVFYR